MKILKSIEELYKEAEELGIDPPDHVAMEYWGAVNDETRRKAKAASFCYLYGGGPGPVLQLKPNTPEDAERLIAEFKKKFPAIGAFHKPLPNVQKVYLSGAIVTDSPWYRDTKGKTPQEFKREFDREPYVPPKPQGPAADLLPHQKETAEKLFTQYDNCPFMDIPEADKTGPVVFVDFETAGSPIVFSEPIQFKGRPFTPAEEMQAEDRMYRKGVSTHRIRVFHDDGTFANDYNIRATSALDARCLAFALDGGCGDISDFDDGHIELAITWTRVIE
jgi:hypothetical protein